jgi:F-type H+-transporting ATPase subunit delta
MTFRGASAEAFEATRRELETVVSGTADAAKVGGDLFSVVAILRSEPGLRRVVTDMSLPAQAK